MRSITNRHLVLVGGPARAACGLLLVVCACGQSETAPGSGAVASVPATACTASGPEPWNGAAHCAGR